MGVVPTAGLTCSPDPAAAAEGRLLSSPGQPERMLQRRWKSGGARGPEGCCCCTPGPPMCPLQRHSRQQEPAQGVCCAASRLAARPAARSRPPKGLRRARLQHSGQLGLRPCTRVLPVCCPCVRGSVHTYILVRAKYRGGFSGSTGRWSGGVPAAGGCGRQAVGGGGTACPPGRSSGRPRSGFGQVGP